MKILAPILHWNIKRLMKKRKAIKRPATSAKITKIIAIDKKLDTCMKRYSTLTNRPMPK